MADCIQVCLCFMIRACASYEYYLVELSQYILQLLVFSYLHFLSVLRVHFLFGIPIVFGPCMKLQRVNRQNGIILNKTCR